ncbi:RNA polymerase factor sigma-54 [Ureibacillus sp. FSL K6-2830]|uniref:RNA polymerase factor sigma-54 n=1 Tax=Ureibacillus sp. FSL K6-2830 TaxID=2954610 RepID=UPI0030FCAC4A
MQMQVKLENRLMKTLRLDQIQSLEILQMSSLELEQYLIEKANENPLLTLDSENNSFQKLLETSYIKEKMSPSFSSEENHWDFIERSARVQENFEQFFIEQIPLAVPLSDLDVKILKFLICSLDDRLFLDVELAEVAEKFHTTSAHVEEIIQLLQTLEPVGVGARNYIEYLLIQTNRFPNVPPFIKEIIKNDLHLVAENKLKQVAKKYSESLSEIQQAVAFIKNLKPIPAGFKETAIHYIVPDIEVYRAGGEWAIQVIQKNLPAVQINEEYVELLKQQTENKQFLKRYLKDAKAILLGIEKRNKTIYEFVRLLLEIQPDFFEQGIVGLKPMRLKDIADHLKVHISTISRMVKGKYLQTPHGIYSFQSLFSKGIISSSGKSDSIIFIKKRIKELIEQENKRKPLTDEQLAIQLNNEGISISRRTVAKYRIEMNIASSFNRAL